MMVMMMFMMMFVRLVPENIPWKHSCEGPDDMPAHAKVENQTNKYNNLIYKIDCDHGDYLYFFRT